MHRAHKCIRDLETVSRRDATELSSMLECTLSFHIHKARRHRRPLLAMTITFVEASYMTLTMRALKFDTTEAALESLS